MIAVQAVLLCARHRANCAPAGVQGSHSLVGQHADFQLVIFVPGKACMIAVQAASQCAKRRAKCAPAGVLGRSVRSIGVCILGCGADLRCGRGRGLLAGGGGEDGVRLGHASRRARGLRSGFRI